MDLDEQAQIRRIAAEHDGDDLVVLLGSPNPEAAALAAETVTRGDPTYAGPLAGVSLGLPVYHIFEPEVRAQIEPSVYAEQVGLAEIALDAAAIIAAVREVREAAGRT